MLSEFDLIAKYFTRPTPNVTLGVGDDCALMTPAPGMHIAISCDMLVSGTHFFADADPRMLGHKSLAVNLSDLAAMGAKPFACTMALALPAPDETWLKAFSGGFFALADQHGCELIGGDTTRGPLNICVTVFGEVPIGQALRRDAAQVGDDIWVSGTLGDARLGLAAYLKEMSLDEATHLNAANRLHLPTPRVALGMALRGIARAAIDISDGLIGDLGHILKRSAKGARLDVDALPAGAMLAAQSQDLRRRFALAGGDDYELCFTAPPEKRSEVENAGKRSNVPVTRVGAIEAVAGVRLVDAHGEPVSIDAISFDHFNKK
jgi:thiamine-monophosphate kinase